MTQTNSRERLFAIRRNKRRLELFLKAVVHEGGYQNPRDVNRLKQMDQQLATMRLAN